MRKWKLIAAVAGSVGLFALGAVWAQQSSRVGTLSGQDYAEIEQLIYRYGLAIDTCSNTGYDYADLYTADGVFVDDFTDEGFAASAGRTGVI